MEDRISVYPNVIAAVIRAASVEGLDSTATANWSPKETEGRPTGRSSRAERMLLDMLVHARLHARLEPVHWSVLMLKYSSVIERQVEAIELIAPRIVTRASESFARHAVTAWAFPKPRGLAEGKRSQKVLPPEWYEIHRWDNSGRPDRTLHRWNRQIRAWLEEQVNEALVEAQRILDEEGLIGDKAA